MPRKVSAKKSYPRHRRSEVRRKVHEELGEESTSGDDFQAVSTHYATNYGLNYTGQSMRSPRKSAKSRTPNMSPAKNQVTRGDVSNRAGTSGLQQSTRRQSSRGAGTSRTHFTPETRRRSDRVRESDQSHHAEESRPQAHVSHSRRKNKSPKKWPPWLRQIRELQSTTKLLIPKLPFSRVIREVLSDLGSHNMRIQYSALELLQEAAEMYLVQLFADAYRCTLHRARQTLMTKDIELVRYLRVGTRYRKKVSILLL